LKRFQEEVRCSFRRSVLSAHLCRLVVTELHAPCRDPYLCGLLHDIGESRVYRILSELSAGPSDAEATGLVDRYHAHAGGELADRWKLPEEIALVCRKHTERKAPDTEELRVVRIADLLTVAVQSELDGSPAELDRELLEILDLGKGDAEVLRSKGLELARAL
jgi:HD-like signal output (HDOD) protein